MIRQCHTILSAVFTTAFNDQISQLHPCRGVKTPPVAKKLRTIITPDQFDQLYTALPTPHRPPDGRGPDRQDVGCGVGGSLRRPRLCPGVGYQATTPSPPAAFGTVTLPIAVKVLPVTANASTSPFLPPCT
jgi:hypothetical protein